MPDEDEPSLDDEEPSPDDDEEPSPDDFDSPDLLPAAELDALVDDDPPRSFFAQPDPL